MLNLNLMETSQSQSSTGSEGVPERRVNEAEYPEKDDKRIKTYNFLGYSVLIGRNAITNERLVSEHKKLHKKCIWMHVYNAKGAHVVVCLNDKEGPVPEVVMRRAAESALWFSADRTSNKKVIWAELQDVFKSTNGACGSWKTYKQSNVIEI